MMCWKRKTRWNKYFIVNLCFLSFSAVVLTFCIIFKQFAELYCTTVSSFARVLVSKAFGIFPFSLAELLIGLFLPALLFFTVLFVVLRIKRSQKIKGLRFGFYGSIFLLVSVFINTFGVCYFRIPLEENLGISRAELTREQLYTSTLFVKEQLEKSVDYISLGENGSSKNPYSFDELSDIIDKGYDELIKEYDFVSQINVKIKPLFVSPVMTYTHISGFYFPITSEANINTNYPDYVVAFSIAHEKAHQRGIAGEDDTNFVGFLAMMYSDDAYIRYAALMSMYDYFLDSLYLNDIEMFYYFLDNTHPAVLREMKAYSDFFEPYRNSAISKVADTVNDTYIKMMGETDGTKSYGKVVELCKAYIDKNNGLP